MHRGRWTSNAPDPEHATSVEQSRYAASMFHTAPPPASVHFAPSEAGRTRTVTTATASSAASVPSAATHERRLTGRWPLSTFLELGALEGAVPSARLHARYVVQEWGLASLAESTELVVSEFVTNAVKAARAIAQAAIRLWVLSDRARVAVLVWDASLEPPVRINTQGDAENGRGLLLVEAVSQQWGWYSSYFPGPPGPPGSSGSSGSSAQEAAGSEEGKFVWAVIC